jgi:uncharacterized protein YcgI (DUF1989 family)
VNFFVKVMAGADGALSFVPNGRAGATIELRAEMDVLTVLSVTPHPLDPATQYAPRPVAVAVRTGPAAAPDDPCRRSCPENERGFTLTDAYFA